MFRTISWSENRDICFPVLKVKGTIFMLLKGDFVFSPKITGTVSTELLKLQCNF